MLLELAVSAELWIVSGELRDARNTHARENWRDEHTYCAANSSNVFCFFLITYHECIHRLEAPIFPPRSHTLHGAPFCSVARATCTASALCREVRKDAVTARPRHISSRSRFYAPTETNMQHAGVRLFRTSRSRSGRLYSFSVEEIPRW